MTPRLFAVLTILATSAFGQAPSIKTRIVTLALDIPVENAFFLNAGKAQAFMADPSGLGEPLEYTGPRQFILRSSAEEFAAQPPLPSPLASVSLPEPSGLVMLVAGRAPDNKIKLSAYDVSAEGFHAGDYQVFNFSDKIVSLILGTSKFALKPGEDSRVSNPILRERVLDVVVQIAEIKDGEAKKVYASSWGHQPLKRNFVFLFNGSHPSRPIEIRRFADYAK